MEQEKKSLKLGIHNREHETCIYVEEQKLRQEFKKSYITDTTTKNYYTILPVCQILKSSTKNVLYVKTAILSYSSAEKSTEVYSDLFVTITNSHYPV
jgi:hypothetical protein